jgi:hypothetical protein
MKNFIPASNKRLQKSKNLLTTAKSFQTSYGCP